MIRLLIVEDERATIQIIKKLIDFKKFGIELIGEARNGEEAMAFLCSELPPEIVITDMNMPVMDGVSLMRYLQENRKEIRMIVVSGYFDYPYTHAAIQANVQDYILKPIDPKELEGALAECCRKIKEAGRVLVRGTEKRLDEKLYQFLLKETNKLIKMIDYGNHLECDKCMDALLEKMQEKQFQEEDAGAAYLVMLDSVQRYLAENGLEAMKEEGKKSPAGFSEAAEEIRKISHRVIYMEEARKKEENRPLDEVQEYLNKHYAENIRLNDLAEKFHYSKEYLTTIFKRKYGANIGEYIVRRKIEDAKRQLEYTTKNMDEIMESLGYSDMSYFYRQFKKIEGISPGQYRKRAREEKKK